ncbi:Cna protein B-type domain protein [Candidatus Sulfotelmatomonas gaucii]|uniref:Cna protein B-type domain protein n=1 Tax=Candidatus Sulfuritelmatomonas gaucii TaxID=2043161 RepID=A0A2N9M4B5_9BACT|nr:Cna protein B-type domain protein [Candidatus Sulfotelmatomonas gaucii]
MTFHRVRVAVRSMALFILAACLGSMVLGAQSTTQGAIAGSVLDASGAVIPGANVSILRTATGFTVTLVSDSSGYFKAPLLEPGDYTVSISATNFARYRAEHVIVLVGQVTSLEPRLAIASSSTEVVVTEQAPVMNLESPDFTDTLNQAAMQNIPINNRRWSALALSTPGVVSDSNGFGLVSVRGISPILNNIEIDGADDNNAFYSEERGRTREAYSTSSSATREFAVNTGVYSAEYGRAAGGVINSVTKSGTNQIHGQAYFWDKESNWAAYNDYSKVTKLVNGVNTSLPLKPEDLRKIYGFTAGGPIIKDKLFWIYTYDQHTHVFPLVGIPSNPQQFYILPAATLPTGANCTLTPATPEAAGNGYLSGDTVVQDREACTLAARQGISYPQAAYDWAALLLGSGGVTTSNYSGAASISDLGLNSDIGQAPRYGYQEINTPKLDWQINQKQHLSVLFHRLRWDAPGDVQTGNPVSYARDTAGNDFVKLDYGLAKLTSLITPTISNELVYQYGRELEDETQQPFTQYTLADMNNKSGNIPEVVIGSSSSTGYGFTAGSPYYSYRPANPYELKWQVGDILYWSKGNHSLKFGVDMVHNYDYQNYLYEINGYYSYLYIGDYFNDLLNFKNGKAPTASTTATNYGCDKGYSEYTSSATGVAVAGYPCYSNFYQGFGPPVFAINTMDTGFFAQDNWKYSPRLTLELGLRWDHEGLPASFSNLVTATGSFTPYPGLTNHPSDNMDFGPRVGFSYDLFGKGDTVLRGGWGMYFGRITNGNLMTVLYSTGSPNGQLSLTFNNNPLTTGISQGPNYPNIVGGGSSSAKPVSDYFSSNLKLPEVQEYDLLLQQAVGKGTFFAISYLGSMGRRLPNFLNNNIEPCSQAPTACISDTVTVSDASGKGPIPAGSLTINNIYTAYGNTGLFGSAATNFASITEMVSNVNSSYNAMVAEIQNRSLKSIQFDANYTWAHSLDFAQNASTAPGTESWYDPYGNYRLNYGNSSWNIPNRFVAYATYNFPNLNQSNLLKWVVNDWNLDDSFSMQNGLTFTPGMSSSKLSGALGNYWNGAGGLGIIPGYIANNSARYPRTLVDDIRVQKQISFERGYNLQLICNVFNVANHQNVTTVGTTKYTYSGGTFTYLAQGGTPNSSVNTYDYPTNSNNSGFLYTPRQVEITARFNF